MAKACDKLRCPARADVADATTTEYRKGCRRTACREANTLNTRQRRAAKAAKIAENAADPAEERPALPRFDPGADDVVEAVRADLEALDPQHPLTRSLSAVALTLAHQVELGRYGVVPSTAGAARQLVAVLEQLAPAKKDDGESKLDELIAQFMAEDDEDSVAAG